MVSSTFANDVYKMLQEHKMTDKTNQRDYIKWEAMQETCTGVLTVNNPNPNQSFTFCTTDNEILRLDKDGFHYQGQTIKDAGEAYRLFIEFMEKINTPQSDALDEAGLESARYEMAKSTVRGDKLENAIRAYLDAVQSSNATKDVV